MNIRYFNAGFAGGPLEGTAPLVKQNTRKAPRRPTQPNIDQFGETVEDIFPSISMANIDITVNNPNPPTSWTRNRTGTPSYFSFVGQFKRDI